MTLKNLKPTSIYDSYWNFATERQNVFYNRIKGGIPPWTNDQIIQKYKFTNAYRVLDRVTQYLIKNIIYGDKEYSPEDQCFRILLFKLFNKIETWEYIQNNLGEISFATYNYDKYNKILLERIENRETIYSAAYIMPSGKSSFGFNRKHQNNLKLLEYMMKSGLTRKIGKSKSLKEIYEILLSYPTLGSFLAFQFVIDINYSELCDFSEMSFVVAGPGAKNGIKKCFGDLGKYSYEDIIRYVVEQQKNEFEKRGLEFQTLFGRDLHLIDCQNLFCEIDKYSRVAYPNILGMDHRKRIKQQYINHNQKKIDFFFPPKWNLNFGSFSNT